jgi:very-short-patch-repair endonuclease
MAVSTSPRQDTPDPILSLLAKQTPLTARQIVDALGITKSAVNQALYGPLKGKVVQDSSYRWSLAGADVSPSTSPRAAPKTELGRLCRYYLECVAWDAEDGVSAYANSRHDLDYVELDRWPFEDTTVLERGVVRQFIGRVRRDRNRVLHVGYPVRLRHVRARSGWQGFRVEPVLLFDFDDMAFVCDPLPQLNYAVLKALPRTGSGQMIDEAIELANELGLVDAGDLPDPEDVVLRLRQVRPEWDWLEAIDPYDLSTRQAVSELNQMGIYNRVILIASERSPFTRGLETELHQMSELDQSIVGGTALSDWLSPAVRPSGEAEAAPLLESLPLNTEQREAVRRALRNPLTVVTGPPGTGKSQLVSALLINAAWQGKRVLFSSKNNKAVDVVEIRVNALGPRPVLLRVGRAEYQDRLANYLTALLASGTDASDDALYRHHLSVHEELRRRDHELERELDETIRIRNEVDDLEQAAELARRSLGETKFAAFRRAALLHWQETAQIFCRAVRAASRKTQPLPVRLLWFLFRKARFSRLRNACAAMDPIAQYLGIDLPSAAPGEASIPIYFETGEKLAKIIAWADSALRYRERLAELQERRRPEIVAAERMRLITEISANSERLWTVWLRLQPSKFTPTQRQDLGRYVALLKMINQANAEKRKAGKEIFSEFYRLFAQLANCLPCWAVTALSARGKLPFRPGFFDLVVIDEASQCDIASALPLLFRAERAVIIGDPQQLKHISAVTTKQDSILLEKHGLVRGRANWAYAANSLFDLAAGIAGSEDIIQLRDHHRSHATIIGFSNQEFYEGRLRIATRYDRLRRLRSGRAFEPAIRWLHVSGEVRRPALGGAINEAEAAAVVNELRRLLVQGYKGSIGVVSPFRAQAERIRDIVAGQSDLASRLYALEFLSETVHKFQGDERDVMVFSPAISQGTPEGALIFLKRHPNLFNVAITRARAVLLVVGDKAAAERSGVDYLARFARYVASVDEDEAFVPAPADLGPVFPPVAHPERVSDWERILYSALYEAGLRPTPQYEVEQYIIDLALLDGQRKLAIEVDGERYHRAWDGELCQRDQLRNMRLFELGWDVMRFWVYEVRDDLPRVVDRVKSWNANNAHRQAERVQA